MNIVILGAGRIGQYVAARLTSEGHTITLVDTSRERLTEATLKMDVMTVVGTVTDYRLLRELVREKPELMLLLTDNDEANLVAARLIYALQPVRTIARLQNNYYSIHEECNLAHLFALRHIVMPDVLVAHQLATIALNDTLYGQRFFHGEALLRTVRLPSSARCLGRPLKALNIQDKGIMIGLIRRQDVIHIPHGEDVLLEGDEVTFIGNTNLLPTLQKLIGGKNLLPRSCLIMGGELASVYFARELQKQGVGVSLAASVRDMAVQYARDLQGVPILHVQGSAFDFLQTEKVDQVDVFVAASTAEEKNLQLALFAKELGCKKTIALFSDEATTHIAEKYGIHHVVSPRIAACDRICALVTTTKFISMQSLYDERVEILEIKVSKHAQVAGMPLSQLGPLMPKDVLIAAIQHQGRVVIATGSHTISPHDEVIVISKPEHRKFLEELF